MKSDSQHVSTDVLSTGGSRQKSTARPEPPHLILVEGDELQRVGPRIKAARCKLQLSIEDLNLRTRVPPAVLRAIEDMDADRLPDLPYLRGHLRGVAEAVKLDPRHIIDAYIDQCGLNVQEIAPVQRHTGIYLVLAVVVGIAVMVGIGLAATTKPPANEGALVNSAQLTDTVPAVKSGRSARQTLTLVALRPASVEIRGSDGTVFISRVMLAGETFAVRRDWLVTAGDGGAFSWRLGERHLGSLAADGLRVYALSVASVLDGDEARGAGG